MLGCDVPQLGCLAPKTLVASGSCYHRAGGRATELSHLAGLDSGALGHQRVLLEAQPPHPSLLGHWGRPGDLLGAGTVQRELLARHRCPRSWGSAETSRYCCPSRTLPAAHRVSSVQMRDFHTRQHGSSQFIAWRSYTSPSESGPQWLHYTSREVFKLVRRD